MVLCALSVVVQHADGAIMRENTVFPYGELGKFYLTNWIVPTFRSIVGTGIPGKFCHTNWDVQTSRFAVGDAFRIPQFKSSRSDTTTAPRGQYHSIRGPRHNPAKRLRWGRGRAAQRLSFGVYTEAKNAELVRTWQISHAVVGAHIVRPLVRT